jgi:hypothetical protein
MSGTSLTVSRGGAETQANCYPNPIDRFAWEFIEWPSTATVAQNTVTIANAALAGADWPLAGFATDRTLVYSAAQGPSGQGSGEGEANNTNTDLDFEHAAYSWDAGVIQTNRARADAGTGTSTFTPYAVTFSP